MHSVFVEAVNKLGEDKAVPKKILENMNMEGITRENVASHLQKYRMSQQKQQKKEQENSQYANSQTPRSHAPAQSPSKSQLTTLSKNRVAGSHVAHGTAKDGSAVKTSVAGKVMDRADLADGKAKLGGSGQGKVVVKSDRTVSYPNNEGLAAQDQYKQQVAYHQQVQLAKTAQLQGELVPGQGPKQALGALSMPPGVYNTALNMVNKQQARQGNEPIKQLTPAQQEIIMQQLAKTKSKSGKRGETTSSHLR